MIAQNYDIVYQDLRVIFWLDNWVVELIDRQTTDPSHKEK